MSSNSTRLRGAAMLAATAIAWGGMFPIMKPLLTNIDPVSVTLIRFGFAVPVLVAFLIIKEGLGALSTEGRTFHLWWLGTLGFAGFGLLLVLGLNSTRPEHAAVIPALMPLIAIVVSSIRSRAMPTSRSLIAVMMGIAGVCLVVTRGELGSLLVGGAGHGEALVLLGATCWVLYTFGASKYPSWSGLRFTTLTLTLGTLSIALIEGVAVMVKLVALPSIDTLLRATPSFIYLVFAASVMGFLFWNTGMRALGAARGVLFINLVPVTAFGFALVAGPRPSGWEFAGVALVIFALMVNSLVPLKMPQVASAGEANDPGCR